MSRILKAYRTKFYQLLKQVGARRVDQGVDWFVAKAQSLSAKEGISPADALTLICEKLAARPRFQTPRRKQPRTPADISFFCDGGLGGLARWLRAAGYLALWEEGIPDELLLKKARASGTTIVTTDSMLMERRLLRDKIIPAMWLPPTLSIAQQLERVFGEFELSVGHPRCMSCGGELLHADKEGLRERIPPKTYRWLNQYFVCQRCGKLFWHGTHWLRITKRLKALAPEKDRPPGSRQIRAVL
jgi:uncharacterized protein with PIN domain